MNHADLYEVIARFKKALSDPDKQEFTLVISRAQAQGVLDYFQHMDPDMPPAPICKALGPLVGDMMMNDKLQRLDAIVDSLGPQVLRLMMVAEQLERRRR